MGRRWFIALATLALMLQVLVPQGFMVSASQGPPTLVICTGHGPLLSTDDHGHPAKAPKSTPDMPCGFAAHGAGAAPPPTLPLYAAPVFAAAAPILPAVAQTPGLGLAAPPPPAVGPPRLI
jgi:hypothetical protein